MPRPRKKDDDRRTETIAFRATPAERLRVEQAAVAAGLTASEFARRLTLKGRVVVEQTRTLDHAAFDELRRIGVNLNQIARRANQTDRIPRELSSVCVMLEQILVREVGEPPARPAAPAPEGTTPDSPKPSPHGP